MPGTTKLHRLEENLGAAAIRLGSRELADIDVAVAGIELEGGRYPAHLGKLVGR